MRKLRSTGQPSHHGTLFSHVKCTVCVRHGRILETSRDPRKPDTQDHSAGFPRTRSSGAGGFSTLGNGQRWPEPSGDTGAFGSLTGAGVTQPHGTHETLNLTGHKFISKEKDKGQPLTRDMRSEGPTKLNGRLWDGPKDRGDSRTRVRKIARGGCARACRTAALRVPGELQDRCSGHKCARGTHGAGPARSGLEPGSSRRAGQVCRSYIPPTE